MIFPTSRRLTVQTKMKYSELVLALDSAGASDSAQEARVILEELFGVSYADVLLDREREYDSLKIIPVIEKRKEKIPLQYIIGAWYFMGEKFSVSPTCNTSIRDL